MHDQGNLELFLIFLIAAVVAVPLFRRFGLGAVLGYLFAGAVLGPFGFRVVQDSASIAGLLRARRGDAAVRDRPGVVAGAAVGDASARCSASAACRSRSARCCSARSRRCSGSAGRPTWSSASAWRCPRPRSACRSLAERKALNTGYGRMAFAILLFQDLVAIPLLALIPLLGEAKAAAQSAPPMDAVLRAVGMIALVVIGGRLLLRQLFRAVAWSKMAEVFTATSLLVVVGTAWLMQWAGMSMGLGAFLAGVLLADSEFRHELEAQIEPFKGLLLGLFFIAVGMSIDLQRVMAEPALIAPGRAARCCWSRR